MRNAYLLAALTATSLLGACKWTDFDDLEDETWVRSTEDPELGASDYAIAIAGVSTGTSGGVLAVVSDDNANFSTLEYDSAGGADVGANPVDLGTQKIGAISEVPVFATDPMGRIGLVERSITGGNFAVLFGSATAPTALEFAAAASPAPTPDAAVYVPAGTGHDFVFAAGSTLYSIPPTGGTPIACMGMDNNAMPLQVAAMDHDGTNLWVWSKSGSLFSYPLASLSPCTGGTLPAPTTAFTPTAPLAPAPGARVHVEGDFAVLTGHPSTTRSGSVLVVKLSDLTQVGTTLTVEGLRTSTLAVLEGETYLVLGIPDRAVNKVAAGEVDLHTFNTTSGVLDATPALSLHDASPDSGQLFGRTVTTMSFNGSTILVIGADNEIYAYYRTALYDHLP